MEVKTLFGWMPLKKDWIFMEYAPTLSSKISGEMRTLMKQRHPAVFRQQLRVLQAQLALNAMIRGGHVVDEERVDEVLDGLLQRAQAELAAARKVYATAHPRLALLELRLQVIGQVLARRALLG